MKHVLFITNYAAPYRVHFFDELGKHMDVTVLFSDPVETVTHRSQEWFEKGQGGFNAVQLKRRVASLKEENLCLDVITWLKKPYDAIVISGYASPTAMLAMAYLKLRRIPFYMEVDGGLIRQDSRLKYAVKKVLVSLADSWISTGEQTTKFLVHYGAKEERISEYPFSSLHERDVLDAVPIPEKKKQLRRELGIEEEKMVLSIGQFIHRKGYDILLRSAADLEPGTGIYIIGGEPTEEYTQLCHELGLTNVHFLPFMKKDRLIQYYCASDVFVLPTREDIWGLVINEAMAYGLPVITTDRCVAGLELVEDSVNGFIVPVEDHAALSQRMNDLLQMDLQKMGAESLERVRPYTIENMVKAHVKIFM